MLEQLNNKCLFNSEKGMAVVLVLIFTGILMALGAALITNAVNEKLITGYNTRELKLYYITEAGIEAGIAILHESWEENDSPEPFFVFDFDLEMQGTLGEGAYAVSFNELAHCPDETYFTIEVNSAGTLKETGKTMTAIVTLDANNFTVTEWQKPVPVP